MTHPAGRFHRATCRCPRLVFAGSIRSESVRWRFHTCRPVYLGLARIAATVLRRGHLQVPLPPKLARRATIRFSIGNLGYISGIGIAFVSAPASLALSGLVAAYYLFEQTPARAQSPPG